MFQLLIRTTYLIYFYFLHQNDDEASAESKDKLSMDIRQGRRFGKWRASKVLNVTKTRNYERCTSRPPHTFSMLPFSLFAEKLFVPGVRVRIE